MIRGSSKNGYVMIFGMLLFIGLAVSGFNIAVKGVNAVRGEPAVTPFFALTETSRGIYSGVFLGKPFSLDGSFIVEITDRAGVKLKGIEIGRVESLIREAEEKLRRKSERLVEWISERR